jgi:hypothetical protein
MTLGKRKSDFRPVTSCSRVSALKVGKELILVCQNVSRDNFAFFSAINLLLAALKVTTLGKAIFI